MLNPSANTMVLFSANVDLIARTTLGGDSVNGGIEMASANYGLSASGYSPQLASTQEAHSNKNIEASYTYTGNLYDGTAVLFGQTTRFTQNVGVTFSNLGAGSLSGRFSAMVTVAGNNSIMAVPEADALWLMLAGGGRDGAGRPSGQGLPTFGLTAWRTAPDFAYTHGLPVLRADLCTLQARPGSVSPGAASSTQKPNGLVQINARA